MSWDVSEHDWCSAAELPERLGIAEDALTALEERTFDSRHEALSSVEAMMLETPVVAAKAVVPKLPAETAKAIEKFKAKLPDLKAKLVALVQPDPKTGEETWRKAFEAEVIARNQVVKVESRSCKGCGSKIATAHIRTYLCPVCLTYPFLQTETDSKALAAKEEKVRAIREEIESADQRIAEIEAEGLRSSDELKRVWLVFRMTSCGSSPA